MASLGRILVVDDQRAVADMVRDLLVDVGYEVEIALTGTDALTIAPAWRPDVILLDLGMPGLPGQAVLDALQRLDPTASVVIVTGNKDLEIARSTLAAGAFDYLPKPFTLEALERVTAAAIVEHERRVRQPPAGGAGVPS